MKNNFQSLVNDAQVLRDNDQIKTKDMIIK